jgi:hypothetical protein
MRWKLLVFVIYEQRSRWVNEQVRMCTGSYLAVHWQLVVFNIFELLGRRVNKQVRILARNLTGFALEITYFCYL